MSNIVKMLAFGNTIQGVAVDSTQIVARAQELHRLSPVAAAALGRTLSAAVMMASDFKGVNDILTVQIKGDGPLGGILVTADAACNVKGYVHNPNVDLPPNNEGKLDVSGAVGINGYLNVIRDIGFSEPYVGNVALVSGEIAEDFTHYYSISEQIPSAVALGVLVDKDGSVKKAGGYMIHLMPGADDKAVQFVESGVNLFSSVTSLLEEGQTPAELLELIFGGANCTVVAEKNGQYHCNCSQERMERNLMTLGEKDLRELAEDPNGIELSCHFCNRLYRFSQEDTRKILDETLLKNK